jgi:hypothetical protein
MAYERPAGASPRKWGLARRVAAKQESTDIDVHEGRSRNQIVLVLGKQFFPVFGEPPGIRFFASTAPLNQPTESRTRTKNPREIHRLTSTVLWKRVA